MLFRSLNKIHVIMKLDGNIIIDKIVYTSNSSVSNYYYPEKPEGFEGTYYFRVIISKDKICNSEGNFETAKGKFYVSVVYAHAEALVDFLKGNIEVEIHGLERNKNNITSIYGLTEISKARYTLGIDYDYTDKYVGNCSINFGNSDVPSCSYITGLNDFGIKDGTYTYPATSNHLSIFGYNNKFKMIKHGFIAGYNNILDAYYTGAGIQGCLCIGRNNNFTEEKANRDYYIGIIGQNIKAVQSGLFVGAYGTIPSTEIFAVCNGTSKEDKTLLSVNRNTGAVTSISTPTENNHLTTKKYVDDKIDNIPDAYTLLYPKEVDGENAYYDIYDLPLGDYRIAQQNGIATWNICVYVNNIRNQIFSTQNCRGFSFTKRSNLKISSATKPGKMILIDVFSTTTGGETFTFVAYDDGSIETRNHKATILSANTNTEFTPTSDYQPATKKYVDDAKASIVVPTKTSELTNDSNFLTEHQSLTGLATETYVNNKVAGIVNSAPETLDTLQELATALGNDANFATTVSTQIGKKVDKVDGMSLTHNDLTNELKANYDAAYTYSQAKHSYNDLTDKPTIPSIDGLATEEYVQNAIKSAGTGSSDVATDDEVKTTINTILGGDYIE